MEKRLRGSEIIGEKGILLSQRVLWELIGVLRKGGAAKSYCLPYPDTWFQECPTGDKDWEVISKRTIDILAEMDSTLRMKYSKLNSVVTTWKRWFVPISTSTRANEDVCNKLAEFMGISMVQFREYQSDTDDWDTIAKKKSLEDRILTNSNIVVAQEDISLISEPIEKYFDVHYSLNEGVFREKYFEDTYYEELYQLIAKQKNGLILADMGAGKTTLISRIGKTIHDEGRVVYYVTLSEKQFTGSKSIIEELRVLDNVGAVLFVDDCHDAPEVASELLATAERFPNLILILATRPIPSHYTFHQRTSTKYVDEFSAETTISMVVDWHRVINVVNKYKEAYHRPDAQLGSPAKLRDMCAANLKLLEIQLDTWRGDEFQGQLDEQSLETMYAHILAEYNYQNGENEKFTGILKIAAMAQFDLNYYPKSNNEVVSKVVSSITKGHVRVGEIIFNYQAYKFYRLPHATIGKYLLDAAYISSLVPNEMMFIEFEAKLLLDYFGALIADEKTVPSQLAIDLLVLFSRLENDEQNDLANTLLKDRQFKSLYVKVLVNIRHSSAEDRKDTLPILFGFLSMVKSEYVEQYQFYFAQLCSKISVDVIIIPDINSGLVDVNLFFSMLDHYQAEKRCFYPILEKVDWKVFGSNMSANASIPALVKTIRKLKKVLRSTNLRHSLKTSYTQRFINGFAFNQMGIDDQSKSHTKVAYNIKGLLDAKLTIPLRVYIRAHGVGLFASKMKDIIEGHQNNSESHLPVFYFCLTHIETVMDAEDVEAFVSGFTWSTLNYYLQHHVSFDVVAIIEEILLRRYTYAEINDHGVDLNQARLNSLINHPLCQIRIHSGRGRDKEKQETLIQELKPKLQQQSGYKEHFSSITTMAEMNLIIANTFDIGLPEYQDLIYQEFYENFDVSIERWLAPASLEEIGKFLSYFAKGANKRIDWNLPQKLDLERLQVGQKISEGNVLNFNYFITHLVNFRDEENHPVYLDEAKKYLTQNFTITQPDELIMQLEGVGISEISFFLGPVYRMFPEHAEKLLNSEDFNSFVKEMVEKESKPNIKDVLSIIGTYILFDVEIPFTVPRTLTPQSIGYFNTKEIDKLINNGLMASQRVIVAMNRLLPVGLNKKYLEHAEGNIKSNPFSDKWKNIFIEQIYSSAKLEGSFN